VGGCLAHAADPPLQRLLHEPPVEGVAVDRRAGDRLVRRQQLSTVPTPPTGSGCPKRHALTQSQPRSSTGSPRWTSSQSMTARSPSSPTITFPMRRSPWTTAVPEDGGRCDPSHRCAASNVGDRSSTASYAVQYCSSVSISDRPGTSAGSMAWRPARKRPSWPASTSRAVANSSSGGSAAPASRPAPGPSPARRSRGSSRRRRRAPRARAAPPAAGAHGVRLERHRPRHPGPPGGSRRRISSRSPTRNAHVSREARPRAAAGRRPRRPRRAPVRACGRARLRSCALRSTPSRPPVVN
jgi:hypothetical protein